MSKTVIGTNNKILYLQSELEQHYITRDISNARNAAIYVNELLKLNTNAKLFVVPDKSVICTTNLPEQYKCHPLKRIVESLRNVHIIDLKNKTSLTEDDYYTTDTHINSSGALKIAKNIVSFYVENQFEVDYIDSYLERTLQLNFKGDLTAPINLKDQSLVETLELKEDIIQITNVEFKNYINLIYVVPVRFRLDGLRQSRYIYNPRAIIKKQILIFGDSTTNFKMFEFLCFYFEKVFFYWNHLYISKELYDYIQPDHLIDIRTERFLLIPDAMSKFTIKHTPTFQKLTLLEIQKKMLNVDFNFFNLIISNLTSSAEIENNLDFCSELFLHTQPIADEKIIVEESDILPHIEDAYSLNSDIVHLFKDKDISMILFILKYLIINQNRKYKFEHIPSDFNAETYKRLNPDLQHMNENELKSHYENYGINENRVYK